MQQNPSPSTSATQPISESSPRARGLFRDQRGLSTAEYALLFVVIAVGSLATWKSLAHKLSSQVSNGSGTFDSVLQSHMDSANKDKGDVGHADALGVGAFKDPGGHAPSGTVGVAKTDDRNVQSPAAAPTFKGEQRAEQAQRPAETFKGDQQRAEQAQPAGETFKGDGRTEQAQPATEQVAKQDRQALQGQEVAAPVKDESRAMQEQQQAASNTGTNKQFQEKQDATPTAATNKQDQTKMDAVPPTNKGDTRAVADDSNNKPRTSQPVKGGKR